MTDRAAARVAGILFMTATIAFSVSVVLLDPILGSEDYLSSVGANGFRVGAAMLLELVNHISVASIAVVLFPVLRRFSTRAAVGYVAARSIESVLFAVGTMHLVALAHLSRAYANAGAAPEAYYLTMGDALLAGHEWDNAGLLFTAFCVGALVLNWALLRTRLVPTWMSSWGLFGAVLLLAARVIIMSGLHLSPGTVLIMDAPIMLQEMVFAVWLIAKGFDADALSQLGRLRE
jgi:hypothetical protein